MLWLTPWTFSDAQAVFVDIFRTLFAIKQFAGRRIIIFLDDPVAFGSAAARDVATAARNRNVEVVFVVGVRTTDWTTAEDRERLVGSLPVADEVAMPANLDDVEFGSLPEYLKRLGIVSSDEEAAAEVNGAKSRNADDTLSMLHFLLPATLCRDCNSSQARIFPPRRYGKPKQNSSRHG